METPGRPRTAAIPVLDPMELRAPDPGVTAPSAPGPGTTGSAGAEAVGGPGEAAEGVMEAEVPMEAIEGAIEEAMEGVMEAMEGAIEARLEEEGHQEGTKSTTTASRALLRRPRPGRSSRHQELCQATTTTTVTGSTATTTVSVVTPVARASVQVRRCMCLQKYFIVLHFPGDELEACIAVCPGFSARLVLSPSLLRRISRSGKRISNSQQRK